MASESILPPLPLLMRSPGALTAAYTRELLPRPLDESALTQAGISVRRLTQDAHYRVPLYQAYRLFDLLMQRSGDALMALRQARHLSLKAFPWLGMSVLASTTLGEGLRRLMELEPLIWDAGRIRLLMPESADQPVRLVWEAQLPTPPAVIELALAGWVLLGPGLWQLREGDYHLSFAHPARAAETDYEKLLGCPVRFRAAENALHFPASWLTRELKFADPGAGAMIQREAQRLLALAPLELNLENHLRARCFQALPGALPTAAELAQALKVPHRQLRELMMRYDLNLRDVQDEVRREAALHWAAETTVEAAALAQAVGFSEQSAFQRAFRRWTGLTPKQWRATSSSATPTL